MSANKSLRLTLFVALVFAVCLATQVAQAATVIVGTCKSGIHFPTIQAAVNASPVGGTVDVCPGTYPEQVTITKQLTLIGIVSGTSDAAVIVSPAGGVQVNATDITNFPTAAQIFVNGATGATISHLTVDGANNGLSGCGTDLVGIYYKNSSGTITDSVVRNQILDPSDEGCQDGLAINVESTTGTPSVVISNNSVRNYDKNGITADGLGGGAPGPNVTVKGNTVIGIGATSAIAQNGIQIGFGATGSVTSNEVADDIYTLPGTASSGILIYASSGVTVSSNVVESTQLGIVTNSDQTAGAADGASITSNKVGGTLVYDAIDLCSNNNSANSNTIFGSAESGVHIDSECTEPDSTTTGNNNTVEHNTINEGCAGILLGSGNNNTFAPNIFYNVTNTTLAGDACPAGPKGAGKSGKHQSLRPAPYKSRGL